MTKTSKRAMPKGPCIYCNEPSVNAEHMPPKEMFFERDRPDDSATLETAMVFDACKCNNKTGMADQVACFMAMLSEDLKDDDRKMRKVIKLRDGIVNNDMGVIQEIFGDNPRSMFVRNKDNILLPIIETSAGARTAAHLDVFSAKLGMALYRAHVGENLPKEGGVYSAWFLNSGIGKNTVETLLKILPGSDWLQQGERKSSKGQFFYRFNSDNRTIVATLSQFHKGLLVFNIASSEPEKYDLKRFSFGISTGSTGRFTRSGEILGMMPLPYRAPLRSHFLLTPQFGLTRPTMPFSYRKRLYSSAGW
jgi:hypothetical protein